MFATVLLLCIALVNSSIAAPTPAPAPALTTRETEYWTVINFSRNCANQNCNYDLKIITPSGTTHCSLEDNGQFGSYDATTHSFFGVSCVQDPNWYLGWGYVIDGDWAVLTVANHATNDMAWFGFNDVNAGRYQKMVGPSAVTHQPD